MLQSALTLLEKIFPSTRIEIDDDTWNSNLSSFCEELLIIAEKLFGVVRLSIPNRLFSESKQEIVVTNKPGIVVSEYRLRPQTIYYQKTGQEIPQPENPKGPHATGIELSMSLCRGYPVRDSIRKPWLSIEFSVWGYRERNAFHELFIDYRRFIDRLLEIKNLKFRTSCVFENVDQFKGRSAFKRLDLYYKNEHDNENTFTLEREFGQDATADDLIGTLLPLVAIYDASFGYSRLKKDKDRILDYVTLIKAKS